MTDDLLDIRLWVHYGQADLVDGEAGFGVVPLGGPSGMLCPGPRLSGHVTLLTGLHTGYVDLSVNVTGTDPGPALDEYEDAVEVSLYMPQGAPVLVEWAGEGAHTLPEPSTGPGWYRLRYHARDADAGADDTGENDEDGEECNPVDAYLLQIWPAPEAAPRVVAAYSRTMRYWLAAGS
ncbi:hypothetical protein ACOQFV_29600 [Nocardiopsis changdeensis]|uniref:Uncharacterized protein n=1 Tax=Nocardiopsis changdeensis TaxID=2831969 RepID=A0ABX8BRX6_9ACTN|nr:MULTISPECIES: hypothetical protein [Nocardiopsis]QUX25022.1 hypothetical protein KGD84_12600 [Nocardiopsis changdeensis]QYX35408.1 hypothetical protein K1J57_22050 [Nocardiopsis sp. MT53]